MHWTWCFSSMALENQTIQLQADLEKSVEKDANNRVGWSAKNPNEQPQNLNGLLIACCGCYCTLNSCCYHKFAKGQPIWHMCHPPMYVILLQRHAQCILSSIYHQQSSFSPAPPWQTWLCSPQPSKKAKWLFAKWSCRCYSTWYLVLVLREYEVCIICIFSSKAPRGNIDRRESRGTNHLPPMHVWPHAVVRYLY